ncbi:MAG: DNA polymerase III subunit alpha [Planctomycetaceae bacterium]|nr:DNA polymerase III subunit alpha [Planctomycetaceae bacterium]
MADTSGQFVHLHLHSQYSLLDGGNRIDRLVERVKQLGMSAVAVTDHGNLHGAVEFYTKAKAAGIRPILGIEAYVALGDRTDRTYTGEVDGGYHLVLLAENQIGWQNLLKLSSDSFLSGFYYRPRMDHATLEQWSQGLIAINGHLGSSIAAHLVNYVRSNADADYQKAVDEAQWHKQTFGVNDQGESCFFIELQHHGVEDQEKINPHLIRLAEQLDLPIIGDNDAHFLLEDDWDAHDSLCCISMGKTKEDNDRLKYSRELYVKSPADMTTLFAEAPEAAANSVRIAERCNVDIDFDANHAPVVKIVSDCGDLPNDAVAAADLARGFNCDYPIGSGEWFTAFCAQIHLEPFDSHKDHETAQELQLECDGALRALVEAGAIWRYGPDGITDDIRVRIDRELQILSDKLISAYFLIVWDFVNYARNNDIPACARGSGVGTMVGYCLGLSNACPVKYGLLFERFTDPDRSEYPDIDIDLCQDGRAQVIEYVSRKYQHVAQVIVFSVLKAKAAIRDVGRVLNVPLPDVDRIAKLVPDTLGITLEEALKVEPDLRKVCEQEPLANKVIETARRLEGLPRHTSIHAAAVVIATEPLENIVPLYQPPGTDQVVTQWDGPTCERVGLLKMDFLGLRTLSTIERARQIITNTLDQQTQKDAVIGRFGAGPRPGSAREFGAASDHTDFDPLDLDRLTFDDQNVLDLFRRGDTAGIFQFESGGMRNLLMGMKPDRIEDLIAAVSLYRPGPMELIPDYNDRKNGRAAVPAVHPVVDQLTDETYGVITYQEQVMQLIHELGGVPLREAYTVIKAVSKKKRSIIDKCRATFFEGALHKGMTKPDAEALFQRILSFSGYGFNKSHAAGYTIVAYQTAYLKTYFPLQYMAALLTFEAVSTDKVLEYVDDCQRVLLPGGHQGIDVRPPDVNLSGADFTVVYDEGEPHDPNHGHIRFGLSAVKGIGERAVESIVEARDAGGPFRSLFDFCERVPQTLVNKSVIEALIKCGAFDGVHETHRRSAMVAAIETAMSRGAQEASIRSSDDFLFGAVDQTESEQAPASPEPQLPDVPAWDSPKTLKQEKSVLGFYISSHPMERHREQLDRFSSATVRDVQRLQAEVEVTLGGMLPRVRPTFVKNGRSAGQKMAMITVEDRTGSIDGVIFSDAYAQFSHLLEPDEIVFLTGRVDRRREEPSIVIDRVLPVDEAPEHLSRGVKIRVQDQDQHGRKRKYNGELSSLKNLLRQSGGSVPVFFEVHAENRVVLLKAKAVTAKTDHLLPSRVDAILQDDGCCELVGPRKVAANTAVTVPDPDETWSGTPDPEFPDTAAVEVV